MSDKTWLKASAIAMGTGMAAALTSLALSAFFSGPQLISETLVWVAFFVVVEEGLKLAFLSGLFSISSYWENQEHQMPSALLFGFGYGVFELGLLAMQGISINFSAWLIVIVHVVTTYFLMKAIFAYLKFKKKWISIAFILLAIVFHLCYNLVAYNFVSKS